VVLQCVEVTRLGADRERELRHLAGCIRVIRREFTDQLGLRVAASAGCKHNGSRVHGVIADTRAPTPACVSSSRSGAFILAGACPGLPGLAEALRDRVAGAVAHLQQALRARAATARKAIPAVVAGELDPELSSQ